MKLLKKICTVGAFSISLACNKDNENKNNSTASESSKKENGLGFILSNTVEVKEYMNIFNIFLVDLLGDLIKIVDKNENLPNSDDNYAFEPKRIGDFKNALKNLKNIIRKKTYPIEEDDVIKNVIRRNFKIKLMEVSFITKGFITNKTIGEIDSSYVDGIIPEENYITPRKSRFFPDRESFWEGMDNSYRNGCIRGLCIWLMDCFEKMPKHPRDIYSCKTNEVREALRCIIIELELQSDSHDLNNADYTANNSMGLLIKEICKKKDDALYLAEEALNSSEGLYQWVYLKTYDLWRSSWSKNE